jgi:hypothetical protein
MKALAILVACLTVAASPSGAAVIHAVAPHPPGAHDGHGHRHHGVSVGIFAPDVIVPGVTADAPAPEVADLPAFIEPQSAPFCPPARPRPTGPHIIYIGAKPATNGPKVIYGAD